MGWFDRHAGTDGLLVTRIEGDDVTVERADMLLTPETSVQPSEKATLNRKKAPNTTSVKK